MLSKRKLMISITAFIPTLKILHLTLSLLPQTPLELLLRSGAQRRALILLLNCLLQPTAYPRDSFLNQFKLGQVTIRA